MELNSFRNSDLILQEVLELNGLINQTKELLKTYTDDFALQITLKQGIERQQGLQKELKLALADEKKHSIIYSFKDLISTANLSLDMMIENMERFRNMLVRSSRFLIGTEEPFEGIFLNELVPGSLGLLITTLTDEKFISDYDAVFNFVFNTIEIFIKADENAIHNHIEKAFKNDPQMVWNYRKYFEVTSKYKKNVMISWEDPKESIRKLEITLPDSIAVYDILQKQLTKSEELLIIPGTIKGISLIRHKIEFIRSDMTKKKLIKCSFDEGLIERIKQVFNIPIKAKIKLIKEINDITGEETDVWSLLQIIS